MIILDAVAATIDSSSPLLLLFLPKNWFLLISCCHWPADSFLFSLAIAKVSWNSFLSSGKAWCRLQLFFFCYVYTFVPPGFSPKRERGWPKEATPTIHRTNSCFVACSSFFDVIARCHWPQSFLWRHCCLIIAKNKLYFASNNKNSLIWVSSTLFSP